MNYDVVPYVTELLESGEEITFKVYNFEFKLDDIEINQHRTHSMSSSNVSLNLKMKVYNPIEESFSMTCLLDKLYDEVYLFFKYFGISKKDNIVITLMDGENVMTNYDSHFTSELLEKLLNRASKYSNIEYRDLADKDQSNWFDLKIKQKPVKIEIEYVDEGSFDILFVCKLEKMVKEWYDEENNLIKSEDITEEIQDNPKIWYDFIEYYLDWTEVWDKHQYDILSDFYSNPLLNCSHYSLYTKFIN
jgi:hypothetical protein